MKHHIMAMCIFAAISVTATAWAFNRNLTGRWETESNDIWLVSHVGNQANFSTTAYTTDTGRITFEFNGSVSPGSSQDSFTFNGVGVRKNARINNKMCRFESSMVASGYVNGEFGGRVIHMNTCRALIVARCEGVSEPITTIS